MRTSRLIVLFTLSFFCATRAVSQTPEIKFIADTLVVEAQGIYEADPDLATLTFDISSQDKDLKQTYDRASQSLAKVLQLAEANGLAKSDISSGVLTVRPFYGGDRKKRAKSFLVQGHVILQVRDFSKLGPILENSSEDGITDFRSLTYSLADEEAAKQKAVAEAMKRAVGRANAALQQKGQKVGSLRFANLDVQQLAGVTQVSAYQLRDYNSVIELESVGAADKKMAAKVPPPPPPIPQPEKITVNATVQCAFQIQ